MRFVDTNILLYCAVAGDLEAEKAATAADLLGCPDLCLSVQVLQEFYFQATHERRKRRLSHGTAAALINKWKRYPVQPMTVQLLDNALATKERWGISYWDAAIIEAARLQGCCQVLSEDMADGQDYGGVQVMNPFAMTK
jgi:predicted nucleic acid-binding protein